MKKTMQWEEKNIGIPERRKKNEKINSSILEFSKGIYTNNQYANL